MPHPIASLRQLWQQAIAVRPAAQPWQLSACAALAVGVPVAASAASDQMAFGGLAALGALVILHRPVASVKSQAAVMGLCALAVTASMVLGLGLSVWPGAGPLLFAVLIAVIVAATRLANLPPPGHTLFVLSASSGAAAGFHPELLPAIIAYTLSGGALSILLAIVASTWLMRGATGIPAALTPPASSPAPCGVSAEALIFGLFAGAALAIAQSLGVDRPYWVPISCIAIMRGLTLQSVWTRNLQRIMGTAAGIAVTTAILFFEPSAAVASLLIALLAFGLHRTTARNYAITVLFGTPLSLLLTELASSNLVPDQALMIARIEDIVLGSTIGLAGGALLHVCALRKDAAARDASQHTSGRGET